MDEVRKAFEAHHRGPGSGCRESHEIEAHLFWEDDEDDYLSIEAQLEWADWQAAYAVGQREMRGRAAKLADEYEAEDDAHALDIPGAIRELPIGGTDV